MEQTKSSSETFLNLFDITNVAKIIGIDISKENLTCAFRQKTAIVPLVVMLTTKMALNHFLKTYQKIVFA